MSAALIAKPGAGTPDLLPEAIVSRKLERVGYGRVTEA